MSKSSSPGPSWKNPGGGGSDRPAPSRKPWQPSATPAKPGGPARRGGRGRGWIFAAIFGGALVALIVTVIEWFRPPKPPTLVVGGGGPTETLASPLTVYAANDVQALADWGRKDGHAHIPGDNSGAQRDDWKSALNAAADRGEKVVTLYLAAPGGVGADGKPFLWFIPADASAPADEHRLPIADVLARLAGLPADLQKLLILDGSQNGPSWVHGALTNDFARALRSMESDIEQVPNLVMIGASDEDQRSWVSEEWRQSIFGHLLRQGLEGAAGRNETRVTAWALFEYLEREVPAWARANRNADQTPILLPLKGGQERAQRIELTSINPGSYREPDPTSAPGAAFNIPKELQQAWEDCEQLAAREPRPDAVAPQTWREYLDTLLRIEQLVRAGAAIEQPLRRLGTLKREIEALPWPAELPALAGALPAARAFGLQPHPLEASVFRQMWQPPEGLDLRAFWEKQEKQVGSEGEAAVTQLRLSAAEHLLDTITRSSDPPTPETLAHADRLLATIDGSRPRPEESHFVRMLQRDLAARRPDPALLQQAIKLRVEAERTAWLFGAGVNQHPYAEYLFRWVKDTIQSADRDRRRSEDLLFPADDESLTLARTLMESAAKKYRQAVADARGVAAGIRTRDRVLSRLPYFARWAAAYRGEMSPAEVERLLDRVERVAASAHELAEMLRAGPSANQIAVMKNLAEKLDEDYGELARIFEEDSGRIGGEVLPSTWYALNNALTVPFIPSARRMAMLERLRHISNTLNVKRETVGAGADAVAKVAPDENARRQGRMALAVLGEPWFQGEEARRIGRLLDLRKRLLEDTKARAWWGPAREAGEQIGRQFRTLPSALSAESDRAAEADLTGSAPLYARTAYLSRLIDSAAVPARSRNAVAAERVHSAQDLLIWQTQRAVDEGWADVSRIPGTVAHCESSARLFADSAERLALGDEPEKLDSAERARRLAVVKAARAAIKSPSLPHDWQPRDIVLTDDNVWEEVTYTIQPPAGGEMGYPTVWLDKPSPAVQADKGTSFEREAVRSLVADGKNPPVPFNRTMRFALNKSGKNAPPGKLRFNVLYRGHTLAMETEVVVGAKPILDLAWRPPTGKATFTVVGDESIRQGAVAILIDYTKSMNFDVTNTKHVPGKDESKFELACKALDAVLAKLPQGTRVSFTLFWGDDQRKRQFKQISEPIEWRGTKSQRVGIMNQIRESLPIGDSTPIATAIADVLADPDKYWDKKFAGLRTLVVLTDGQDNITKEPGERVVKALKDSADDVALHLVLFGLPEAEEKNAIRQFETIEDPEHFGGNRQTRTAGRLWPALRNVDDLARVLEEAMLPRVEIFREYNRVERLPFSLPVTLRSENLFRHSPPLDPGPYLLRVRGTPFKIRLEPGDRLLLQLERKGGRLELSIPPYADYVSEFPGASRSSLTGRDYHLTIPRLSLRDRGDGYDLEMVATMERLATEATENWRIARPEFAWFEVRPRDADVRLPMRVENIRETIPPAWQINVSPWVPEKGKTNTLIDAALPRIEAYWVERWPGQVDAIQIDRLGDVEAQFAKMPKDLNVGGIKVKLLGLSLEGGQLCVRLAHEKGKPVLVRPVGLKAEDLRWSLEERHLFYETDRDGRYAARFGPLGPKDQDRQVRLEFYPVEAVKKVARRIYLEMGRPDVNTRNYLPKVELGGGK